MAKKVFDGSLVVGGGLDKSKVQKLGDSIADIKRNRHKIAEALNIKLAKGSSISHTPQPNQDGVVSGARHDTIKSAGMPDPSLIRSPSAVNGFIVFPEWFDVKLPPVHIETTILAALASQYIYVMGVEDGIARKQHRSLLDLQDALPRQLFHDRTVDSPRLNYAPNLTYLAGYRTGACDGGCELFFRYRNCGPEYCTSFITGVPDFEAMLSDDLLEWCVQ